MEQEAVILSNEIMKHVSSRIEWQKRIKSDWYVGRCEAMHIQKTMFKIHNIDKFNGVWSYRTATDEKIADMIVKNLMRLGMSLCGINKGTMVYTYLRDEYTKEGRAVLLEKLI